MVNDDEMYVLFACFVFLGAIAMVHAENGDVVAELFAKLLVEGNMGLEAYVYFCFLQVEGEAVNCAIMIVDMIGVLLYIVHVFCEEVHEVIWRVRMQGKCVWGELLIQYLILDESEYFNQDWDYAVWRVMLSLFCNKMYQDSLWAGLQLGSLLVVVMDYCAFIMAQKRYGVGDFTKISNGIGGLEDRMLMLWMHGVCMGWLMMNEFVAVIFTNIVKILNCYLCKGAVLVGVDADLVVWDFEKTKMIMVKSQQSAIDYNVFEGKEVTGLLRFTLTCGYVVVHDGEMRMREGHGQFVKCAPNMLTNTVLLKWKELTAFCPVEWMGIFVMGV